MTKTAKLSNVSLLASIKAAQELAVLTGRRNWFSRLPKEVAEVLQELRSSFIPTSAFGYSALWRHLKQDATVGPFTPSRSVLCCWMTNEKKQ